MAGHRWTGQPGNQVRRWVEPGTWDPADHAPPTGTHTLWHRLGRHAFHTTHAENSPVRPRIVTVVRECGSGLRKITILLNRRAVLTFEQLLSDISEALGFPRWMNDRVRRLFALSGREICSVSDFFRGDEVFVAGGRDRLTTEQLQKVLEDLLPDQPQEHSAIRSLWQRPLRPPQQTAKADSGFHEDTPAGRPRWHRAQQAHVWDKGTKHGPMHNTERLNVISQMRPRPVRLQPIRTRGEEQPVRPQPIRTRAEEQPVRPQPIRTRAEEQPVRPQPIRTRAEEQPVRPQPIRTRAEQPTVRLQPIRTRAEQPTVRLQPIRTRVEEQPVRLQPIRTRAEEQPVRLQPIRTRAEEPVAQRTNLQDRDNEEDNERDEEPNRHSHEVPQAELPQVLTHSDIELYYELGRVIGDGNFAVVRECWRRDKLDHHVFAMKIIERAKMQGKEYMLQNEVSITGSLSHPNVVQLLRHYESPQYVYLLMELVSGGDLFDAITANGKLPEPEAATLTRDLCCALAYIHAKSIVHRDLKPENLLVQRNEDGSSTLKLADFGLAMVVTEPIFTICGTPTYVAPEILAEKGYGLPVDMWATGVIVYILLCGFPPFRSQNKNQEELFALIQQGDYSFPTPYWDGISQDAKDLTSLLLLVEPQNRISSQQATLHTWLQCVTSR